MSSINTARSPLTNYITTLRRHSLKQSALLYPVVLAGAGAVAIGSFTLARAAWTDYQTYLGYGPGGMPYNVFGWLLTTTVVRALSIDTLDVHKLDADQDQRTWLIDESSGRGPTRARAGGRPTLGPHAIPQRQLDQFAPEEIQQTLLAAFDSIVAHNPTLIETKPSKYERHHNAIWVADACPTAPQTVDVLGYPFSRETAHVHATADYSVHVVLAPKDAARVVRAGWGQLHGFAGVSVLGRKVVPKSYVLLYAPRNETELKVVMDIVRAAVGYMTASGWDDVRPA